MSVFYVIVTKNEGGDIISLYSPDFDSQLLDADQLDSMLDLETYIYRKLLNLCETANRSIEPKTPDKLSQFRLVPIFQTWKTCEVNLNIRYGPCAKYLPIIGNITNISTILANFYITYMALNVNGNQNDKDNNFNYFIAGVGAMLGLVLYRYSRAGASLSYVGNNLDEIATNLYRNQYQVPSFRQVGSESLIKMLVAGTVVSSIIISTVAGSIKIYQESLSLTDRFLDSNSTSTDATQDRIIKRELILYLVIYNFIFSSILSGLAFQANFIYNFINEITQEINRKRENFPLCFRFRTIRGNAPNSNSETIPLTMGQDDLNNEGRRSSFSVNSLGS